MKKRLAVFAIALVGAFTVGTANASAVTRWVNDTGTAVPPTGTSCNNPGYNSIEAAENASGPGDTINVCPGTYTEQVSVEPPRNNVTIRSVVRRAAIIQAPASIIINPLDEEAIVHINGATGVRILGFTITGPGPGPCNSIHYGVWVENSGSATIDDNHITDIRDVDPISLDPPLSGCQNGVGIQVGRKYTDGPTVGTATITRNLIDRYQKNGMTIDNTGSSATVWGNRVIGWGPTQAIAQNGIQVSRGAYANVHDNEVSDNIYTGPFMAVASSAGILLYGDAVDPSPAPGTTVEDNLVYRNDDNIPVYGTQFARILSNRVFDSTRFDGIYMGVDTANNRIQGNFLRRNTEHDCHDDSVGPYGDPPPNNVANIWLNNDGVTQNKTGLCEGAHGDDDNDPEDDEDGEDHDHPHHGGHHGDGHGGGHGEDDD